MPVFTVEFIFLRFDIDWISSLRVSSPSSSAYSLSFHFPCPVPISSFRSLGVCVSFHTCLLMLGAGWMEPDGTRCSPRTKVKSWLTCSPSPRGAGARQFGSPSECQLSIGPLKSTELSPGGSQGVEPGGHQTQHHVARRFGMDSKTMHLHHFGIHFASFGYLVMAHHAS